jgi:arylformamidase
MKLIDISRPITTGMPVWPGDSEVSFSLVHQKAAGADANVGRLVMGVHAGTHADAAYHYNESGLRIDEMPLDLFIGPARVIDIRSHAVITPALLEMLDPAITAWLAARGVRLIGLDIPSVDTLTSTGMPMHHVVDRAGLFILENLDLQGVAAGIYDLIALPLRIKGADGSPIRAVLQTRD